MSWNDFMNIVPYRYVQKIIYAYWNVSVSLRDVNANKRNKNPISLEQKVLNYLMLISTCSSNEKYI